METHEPSQQAATSWTSLTYADAGDPFLKRWLIQGVEHLSGRPLIERLYNEVRFLDVPPGALWGLALKQLQVSILADWQKLDQLPREGPLVFVANHPFGVLDGLMMGELISRVRSDYFILVNEVLARDPRLAGHLLPIDFRPGQAAVRTNLATAQAAVQRIKAGHAMGVFPSGGVATAQSFFGPVVDLEWKRFAAKVIQLSRATVVPIYFTGQNSRLFQMVSQFSMPLRLGLLLYETKNKMGKHFCVEIGDPIPFEEMAPYRERDALLGFLRARTLGLGQKK
jgi:putative hemolysin